VESVGTWLAFFSYNLSSLAQRISDRGVFLLNMVEKNPALTLYGAGVTYGPHIALLFIAFSSRPDMHDVLRQG
jgi:hypothetical protein